MNKKQNQSSKVKLITESSQLEKENYNKSVIVDISKNIENKVRDYENSKDPNKNKINKDDNISKNNTKTNAVQKEKKKMSSAILDPQTMHKKEEQAKELESLITDSGLTVAFEIIFAELISKKILPENFFTYTSMRLRQLGKEIEDLKNHNL